MASRVDYYYEYPYRPMPPQFLHFPVLQIGLQNPNDQARQSETVVYVDSGSKYTVLDGSLAADIGINYRDGRPQKLGSAIGGSIDSWINQVMVQLDGFSPILLGIAFVDPLINLSRPLLGRDFFYHAQIGFWEYAELLYISPNSIMS